MQMYPDMNKKKGIDTWKMHQKSPQEARRRPTQEGPLRARLVRYPSVRAQ